MAATETERDGTVGGALEGLRKECSALYSGLGIQMRKDRKETVLLAAVANAYTVQVKNWVEKMDEE